MGPDFLLSFNSSKVPGHQAGPDILIFNTAFRYIKSID